MSECIKNVWFWCKKCQIFLGRGHTSILTPLPPFWNSAYATGTHHLHSMPLHCTVKSINVNRRTATGSWPTAVPRRVLNTPRCWRRRASAEIQRHSTASIKHLLLVCLQRNRIPTTNQFFLAVPRFSIEFGKRSFSYLAPTVWNGLLLNIRLSPTFDTFKRRLKTHLFK